MDRASKSGKFVKECESMTPVLGINTASCGKKLLRIPEIDSPDDAVWMYSEIL